MKCDTIKKIREINSLMPKYKAIRGFTLTKEALIKTTTSVYAFQIHTF